MPLDVPDVPPPDEKPSAPVGDAVEKKAAPKEPALPVEPVPDEKAAAPEPSPPTPPDPPEKVKPDPGAKMVPEEVTPSPEPDRAAPKEADAVQAPPPPPDNMHEPIVLMSQSHEDACLVKVGARLPDVTLPDLSAQPQSLADLRGPKLTVVVFWSLEQALGREQFRRLEAEVYLPFNKAGVSLVAINVGDAEDAVRAAYEDAGAAFPCLLDADAAFYRSVADAKLPRTYLLDDEGRVVWLDIEYSRSTRRELLNAIHYFLNPDLANPAGDT
jgi:peroxiredoxin